MKETGSDPLGRFGAIESFLVSPDKQFGIIGDVLEGVVRPGAFAYIELNPELHLTVRIDEVKDIQLSGEDENHKLLLFNDSRDDCVDFLHAMRIGSEGIEVRISGDE